MSCGDVCLHSFLLSSFLGEELLGHMVTLCSTFWETARLYSKAGIPFYDPTSNIWESQFLHILTYTCCCLFFYCLFFFIITILVCVKSYFIVLICIFLMTSTGKCLSYAYWPFAYLLWWDVMQIFAHLRLWLFLFFQIICGMKTQHVWRTGEERVATLSTWRLTMSIAWESWRGMHGHDLVELQCLIWWPLATWGCGLCEMWPL